MRVMRCGEGLLTRWAAMDTGKMMAQPSSHTAAHMAKMGPATLHSIRSPLQDPNNHPSTLMPFACWSLNLYIEDMHERGLAIRHSPAEGLNSFHQAQLSVIGYTVRAST